MAKLTITFENNEIKKDLFFKGEAFSYSMIPTESGSKSDAKCFEAQIEDRFGDEDEELLEAASLLDFGDEDEIQEALAILHEIE